MNEDAFRTFPLLDAENDQSSDNVSRSETDLLPPALALAKLYSDGCTASARTDLLWCVRVVIHLPAARSHNLHTQINYEIRHWIPLTEWCCPYYPKSLEDLSLES